MKRKLLQQMRHEWRSNIWMSVQLLVTGLVLWFIFSALAMISHIHQTPQGYDLTDVYVADLRMIPESASGYKPYEDSLHSVVTDRENLFASLRNNPYVESMGMGNNAMPYNYNFSGNSLSANIDGKRQEYMGNLRHMTPELVRTIRLTGINGETPEQMAQMLADGNTFISLVEYDSPDLDPMQWNGRDVFWSYDSTRVEHIGAVIKGIRRSDYEPLFRGVIVMRFPETWALGDDLVIRVKPGKGREFMESLTAEDCEYGNVYITNLRSSQQMRERNEMNWTSTIRTISVSLVFILVAVFLGFLGTFWFRTQQRVPELALRIVNGATSMDLFRRLLSEGLLILLATAPFILGVGALILSRVDVQELSGVPTGSFFIWIGLPCAVAALALMICAGIVIPAAKAMKLDPAQALKEQ